MSEATTIEWADSTFNPWQGCQKISPACDHCYAERYGRRFGVQWGPGQARRRTVDWSAPGRWNKAHAEFYAQHGRRRRVFCASLADWLDNEAPLDWWLDLMELIRRTPELDWLLLSKRIGNWRRRVADGIAWLDANTPHPYPLPLRTWLAEWQAGSAPPHVWLGDTICDQQEANREIPKLLAVPAALRFLSIEPMLGPVDLERPRPGPDLDQGGGRTICQPWLIQSGIDWVICGGESGPHARPMHPDWARSLRDQCAAAGVPFLFKQWGEWLPGSQAREIGNQMAAVGGCHRGWKWDSGAHSWRIGTKAAGRLLDGRTHDEFPHG